MISELHPNRAMGVLVGGALTVWCFVFSAALVWRGVTQPIDLPAVGSHVAATMFFGLGCLFAYWTYSCLTMRYYLDRNGLTIHWGDIRQLIPMDRIQRLVPGRELSNPKITGVSWLGHHVGHGEVGDLGNVLFYATHRSSDELLYVVTEQQTYAISVEDEVRFAEELQGHQQLGQVVSLPQVTERHSVSSLPIWHDPLAQLLALGAVLASAVTLGYVFHQYPGLPESIPFPFASLGFGEKRELLSIPITGLGLLAVNLVLGFALHAVDRAVGYLLFLAAIGTQITLLAAAIITLN